MNPHRFNFRVWNKTQQCFLTNDEIDLLHVCSMKSHNLVFLQSTGLLDRNGKEIFEGDVLRDAEYMETDAEYSHRYTVEYFDGSNYGGPALLASGEYLQNFGKMEVVGNIYEGV